MHSLIPERRAEIEALCRRFDMERLDLFGSGATGRFDPNSSDLDFIVAFAGRETPGYADRYADFAEALEALLQCSVDLLTERSIRNHILRDAVTRTRQCIYDRAREKAAA